MDKFFLRTGDQIVSENTSLCDFVVGDRAVIISYDKNCDRKIKQRLLELGFIQDTIVRVHNISVTKDVIMIELNGFLICLRRDIAKCINCRRIK